MTQATREEERWQRVKNATAELLQYDHLWRDEQVPVPDTWHTMVGGSTTELKSLNLRMPNSRYGHDSMECTNAC